MLDAISALQDVERALHDTRRPGQEIAEPYLAELEAYVASGEGAVLVAEIGQELAGFIACMVVREPTITETEDSQVYGYVSDLYVSPDHRGRKIGKALLLASERLLAERGVSRVRLHALAANSPAAAAYIRTGFEAYEVIFEKRLAQPPASLAQATLDKGGLAEAGLVPSSVVRPAQPQPSQIQSGLGFAGFVQASLAPSM